MDKLYLNTKEVAKILGRSPGAIRNLVSRNRIPYRKPGGRLLFLMNEITEWVEGPTYELDKDVPIPERDGWKYPFPHMEIGASFIVPLNGKDSMRVSNNLYSAAKHFEQNNESIKFTVRYMKAQGGVRCWRIK